MPDSVWQNIYGVRNGQVTLLYSLDDAGIDKISELTQANRGSISAINKKSHRYSIPNSNYNYSESSTSYTIDSWGSFVEYAARVNLDLSGLTLNDEQREHLYEFELQNRVLANGRLNNANLSNFDLSGTNFSGASLDDAVLKNTTGKQPNFSSIKAYQTDFSGSVYNEPNFSRMSGVRSRHVGSTYNMPLFAATDWSSAHVVASRFFVKKESNAGLNLSNALAAGSLFYGLEAETTPAPFTFTHVALPGCCFCNLSFSATGAAVKADFSPLHIADPRLSTEERALIKPFGQWVNNETAMDSVKVSPDIALTLDENKIFSMFSETTFPQSYYENTAPLFFSKGEIVRRESFHDCALVDLAAILPKDMAARLGVVDAPVIETARAEAAAAETSPSAAQENSNTLSVPEITFDKDVIGLQVQALEKASIAEALGIGGDLQVALNATMSIVSDWAIDKIGTHLLRSELNELISSIKDVSLTPTPIVFTPLTRAAPVAAPPPPVAPAPVIADPAPLQKKRRGIFSLLGGNDEVAAIVEAPRPAPFIPPAIKVEAPPPAPAPDKFALAFAAMSSFPDALTASIQTNKTDLAKAEKIKRYLQTMENAFSAYIDELTTIAPDLHQKNPDIADYIDIRVKSLKESRAIVARLNHGTGEFVKAAALDGTTFQWTQGVTVPALNNVFTKVSRIYALGQNLEKDGDALDHSSRSVDLYQTFIEGHEELPPRDRVKSSFDQIQATMLDQLGKISSSLDTMEEHRRGVLKEILSPI